MGSTNTATTTADPVRDIHGWFGLSYANYLVVPRTLLQSMPQAWQHRFTSLLDELHDAFADVEQAECYEVTAGVEREVGALSDAELARVGITRYQAEPDENPDVDASETRYHDRNDHEIESWERIVWPTPDPVPHYNRGRTRIQPHPHGRPEPAAGVRFRKLTADMVLQAYYAAKLGHPDKPGQHITFASPITRDGDGCRAVVEVPDGVTFNDVANARPAIAAGLHVAISQVVITRDPISHRRHVLRVADDPAAAILADLQQVSERQAQMRCQDDEDTDE